MLNLFVTSAWFTATSAAQVSKSKVQSRGTTISRSYCSIEFPPVRSNLPLVLPDCVCGPGKREGCFPSFFPFSFFFLWTDPQRNLALTSCALFTLRFNALVLSKSLWEYLYHIGRIFVWKLDSVVYKYRIPCFGFSDFVLNCAQLCVNKILSRILKWNFSHFPSNRCRYDLTVDDDKNWRNSLLS